MESGKSKISKLNITLFFACVPWSLLLWGTGIGIQIIALVTQFGAMVLYMKDNKGEQKIEEQQGLFPMEIPPEPLPKYKCWKCGRGKAVTYEKTESHIRVCPFCGAMDNNGVK